MPMLVPSFFCIVSCSTVFHILRFSFMILLFLLSVLVFVGYSDAQCVLSSVSISFDKRFCAKERIFSVETFVTLNA